MKSRWASTTTTDDGFTVLVGHYGRLVVGRSEEVGVQVQVWRDYREAEADWGRHDTGHCMESGRVLAGLRYDVEAVNRIGRKGAYSSVRPSDEEVSAVADRLLANARRTWADMQRNIWVFRDLATGRLGFVAHPWRDDAQKHLEASNPTWAETVAVDCERLQDHPHGITVEDEVGDLPILMGIRRTINSHCAPLGLVPDLWADKCLNPKRPVRDLLASIEDGLLWAWGRGEKPADIVDGPTYRQRYWAARGVLWEEPAN